MSLQKTDLLTQELAEELMGFVELLFLAQSKLVTIAILRLQNGLIDNQVIKIEDDVHSMFLFLQPLYAAHVDLR